MVDAEAEALFKDGSGAFIKISSRDVGVILNTVQFN
jgi:hypothetical protein